MGIGAAVLWAALALPHPVCSHGACESGSERFGRLVTIATAIELETEGADEWLSGWTRQDWAAAALVKTWAESGRFDRRVHEGSRRGDAGRSWCLGQVMGGGKRLAGIGLEPTRACYRETLRILLLHACRCRVGPASQTAVARTFGGYGTGYSCSVLPWAGRRAWMWQRVRGSLSLVP